MFIAHKDLWTVKTAVGMLLKVDGGRMRREIQDFNVFFTLVVTGVVKIYITDIM